MTYINMQRAAFVLASRAARARGLLRTDDVCAACGLASRAARARGLSYHKGCPTFWYKYAVWVWLKKREQ